MMAGRHRAGTNLAAGLALALVALPAGHSYAADSSAWVNGDHSGLRLLAGSRSGAVLLGGIHIKIAKGWKTYWRYPGDSGVPPRFDFSKSDNVEAVTVLWPAPKRFPDGAGGFSLGYQQDVVLPLRIVPKNSEKPVTLRAIVDYAVCEKLCLPVSAETELPFESVISMEDGTLRAALDNVPKPATVGDPNALTLIDVKRIGPNVVQADVVSADKDVDIFAEGPTPEWALPVPKLTPHKGAPGVSRFTFDLEGLPTGAKPDGAALKFTLTGGGAAYEFNVNLN